MGCTASKLGNEDTVRRCKERRRLMKEAVFSRHHLAAAHADYCRSLRDTGSALAEFAAGEQLSVSDSTPPAVLLRNPSSLSSRSAATHLFPPRVPSPSPSLHPPPPPPAFSPSPSPTIASSKLPHILSPSSLPHSRRHPPLPLLAASNPTSRTTTRRISGLNSTYSATPSQASSVWNWENFYPPSPPDSEYFQRQKDEQQKNSNFHTNNYHHLDGDGDGDGDVEREEETEREEVQCSEWGDHYSTSSSSDEELDENDDGRSRSEIGTRSNFGSSVHNESVAQPKNYPAMSKSDKFDDAGSSVSYGGGDMKIVVRHRDLAEIVAAIKENFDAAAAAGEKVSVIMETGRDQLNRSFRQLKKTVYHSNGVLSNLSSSWTSKPPLAVKYRLDASTLDEPGGPKSLCSTLERLLAWEKKLCEEVKDREGVKIEHEKKLSTLQSQECKGGDEVKLDKTKTSIKRLQSLIIVTSQAVSTTSTAISGLRDSDLVPQLVELCHTLMYMWRSMNEYHEIQNQIVQQVRGLVNRAARGESTSDLHRQATRDLESAVSAWHSSFCRLIKYQRDFIQSLHGWFQLTLLPVDNDNINGNRDNDNMNRNRDSSVFSFCDEWKLALDRLPNTVASEAIKSFVNVVHAISAKQTEEVKIKKRTESVSKELEKKASALRNVERKYYHSYSMVGLPDAGSNNGQVLDARDPLAEKKSELAACQRRVEEEMLKHSKAVEVTRTMTLNHIQTGLPGVFQAMTSFSGLFMEALEAVCTRSYAIK
ncbi:hypothetical protein L1049_018358 [Liquidambar formosana]|uniref:Uncharacterized protein n=1 Tax=Liquidambar formosana TaxID=63359 RepID=A0AAP0WLS3_LIQFO